MQTVAQWCQNYGNRGVPPKFRTCTPCTPQVKDAAYVKILSKRLLLQDCIRFIQICTPHLRKRSDTPVVAARVVCVCLSVGLECVLCYNSWTDRDAIWNVDSKPCIRWGLDPPGKGAIFWGGLPAIWYCREYPSFCRCFQSYLIGGSSSNVALCCLYCSNLLDIE